MKPFLITLLLLSLAGNAVLAVFAYRQSFPAVPAVASATGAAASGAGPGGVPAKPAASAPVNWQTLQAGPNLHELVSNLRNAGFPPAVIRAIANQLASDRIDRSALDHMPFWKQNFNNPEYVAAQQQAAAKQRELVAELLGPDARASATMEPAARERRFGVLSDEKVDQIDSITREFNDMRTKLYADRKPGDTQGMMSTQTAMEEEMHKELATVLTPAELEQYEMRSSQSASRLTSNLKSVDVTEEEYTALFRAQKAFDAADPARSGVMNADAMALRNTAQAALNEQARTVLTDDRFYDYLKGADANYARAAQFTANYPSITPAMTYDLSQIERDYQSAMMTLSSRTGAGLPPAERMAQLTAARKDYQDKLNTLLGAETATAYAQRNRAGNIIISSAPGRTGP